MPRSQEGSLASINSSIRNNKAGQKPRGHLVKSLFINSDQNIGFSRINSIYISSQKNNKILSSIDQSNFEREGARLNPRQKMIKINAKSASRLGSFENSTGSITNTAGKIPKMTELNMKGRIDIMRSTFELTEQTAGIIEETDDRSSNSGNSRSKKFIRNPKARRSQPVIQIARAQEKILIKNKLSKSKQRDQSYKNVLRNSYKI